MYTHIFSPLFASHDLHGLSLLKAMAIATATTKQDVFAFVFAKCTKCTTHVVLKCVKLQLSPLTTHYYTLVTIVFNVVEHFFGVKEKIVELQPRNAKCTSFYVKINILIWYCSLHECDVTSLMCAIWNVCCVRVVYQCVSLSPYVASGLSLSFSVFIIMLIEFDFPSLACAHSIRSVYLVLCRLRCVSIEIL